MNIFLRHAAYWAADYAAMRATGASHKEAKRTANSALAWGILVFLLILGGGMFVFVGIENGWIETTPI